MNNINLLMALAALGCTLIAGYWAMAKYIGHLFSNQLNQKFAGLESRLDEIRSRGDQNANAVVDLERQLLTLRAELPVQYVRREDYVRGQTVIESKLDALAIRMDKVQLGGFKHD